MTSSEEKRPCNFLVFVDEQDDVGQNPDDTEVFVYIVCVDRSDVETYHRPFPCGIRDNLRVLRLGDDVYD